jgi:hypothetical protein
MMQTARQLFDTIQLGVTAENEHIEFKMTFPDLKDKNSALETAKDFSQFANSWGGIIFYGISEEDKNNNKVAKGVYGITDIDNFKRFVNDRVLPLFHPQDLKYAYNIIESEGKTVLGITIQPGPNLIMLYREGVTSGIIAVERTPYGKKQLSPEDLVRKMNDNSRRNHIILRELAYLKDVEILSPVLRFRAEWSPYNASKYNAFLNEIGENEFRLGINSRMIRIPYSLILHVWKTEFNKIGLILNANLMVNERIDQLAIKPL